MTSEIETIKTVVGKHYGVSVGEIDSRRKGDCLIEARYFAIFIARHVTTLSMPALGRAFGGRDHSTILNAISRTEEMIIADKSKNAVIETLLLDCTTELMGATEKMVDVLSSLIAARVHAKLEAKPEQWPDIEPSLTRLVLDYQVDFPKSQNEAVDRVLAAYRVFENDRHSRAEASSLERLLNTLDHLQTINTVRMK